MSQDDLVVVMLMGPLEHNNIVTVTAEAIKIFFCLIMNRLDILIIQPWSCVE